MVPTPISKPYAKSVPDVAFGVARIPPPYNHVEIPVPPLRKQSLSGGCDTLQVPLPGYATLFVAVQPGCRTMLSSDVLICPTRSTIVSGVTL